ncbi:methyltransferase [Thermoanaerobacterium thermosaccharolyticum]|uniref:tRNA 5-hydroxyuridine methyltransferase n=1 Tax=Thermoanaerobacterium thermosaccharolyticum TaxID=1517 RepID=A0A231VHJ4_THETR|nr:O-methyltransferase [Thermoanaerobacterium thermosaccharolyticum]OXT07673.1 methyltransferase [Thermoanaerobacterium thermosaccharolyticum]
MIDSDIKFVRQLFNVKKGLLKDIENYANENFIPIIKPEVARFLETIVKIKQPQNILEIGTAIGYSSIIMLKAYKNAKVLTIEKDIDMAEMAKINFIKASLIDRVELVKGDALEVLPCLSNKYDLIFIDASKGHYKEFFDESLRVLNDDGILICDNILYKGYVTNEVHVKHKRRTIVYRMRDFISYVLDRKDITTTIIPIGDGLSISVKEEKND